MTAVATSWLNLANKTVLVTGAASGIGAAVCKAFAQQSARVVAVDAQSDRQAHDIVQCNVASESEVQQLFQSFPEQPSILVNCAGITRDGWVETMHTEKQWQKVLDVNLTGTFLCCREFIRQQQKKDNASSIVNVTSVVALQGNMGQANYSASKGGVWSLTKSLAREVAARNIRVNAVAPGFIATPMVEAVPAVVKEKVVEKIALGRMGHVDEVANLILFLSSCERAGYITGETIECSGMISL